MVFKIFFYINQKKNLVTTKESKLIFMGMNAGEIL